MNRKGYLCDVTNSSTLPPAMVVEGSFIKYSLNGYDLGIAFKDINLAEYHPCVSTYMGGCATINFGPKFKYKPSGNVTGDFSLYKNTPTGVVGIGCEGINFGGAYRMGYPCFPCKEDLVKCYVLSNEWGEDVDENGNKIKRRKTYAEVEGLVIV